MKRVLLVNSDLAKNRGDRAIAEGNVQLIRETFPDAKIVGLSENPDRDSRWYGIGFLPMDFQSLSPFDLITLLRVASRSDAVMWGGGEILKDYTNKAALWYWVIKMTLVSVVNSNLYGLYQGIGPTASPLSKRLIAFVAGRTRGFIVRDDESRRKLVSWGVPEGKVHASSDPAVLPQPSAPSPELTRRLAEDGLDEAFLSNFVCIGPRDWFHYKTGGWLPFKYRERVRALLGRPPRGESEQHRHYRRALGALVSALSESGTNLLLVPMHMEESDTELCLELQEVAGGPAGARVLNSDTLSPAELRSVVGRARAMIGFRLHSNIIGVSAGVPSVNIFYVDKGRLFFEQIGQSANSVAIEESLRADFVPRVTAMLSSLLARRDEVSAELQRATDRLRDDVRATFREVVHG